MLELVVDFQHAERLVQKLASAVAARRLYGPEHRGAREALMRLLRALKAYFREPHRPQRFALGIHDGRLTHEGIPVGRGTGARQLAARLESLGAAGVAFLRGIGEPAVAAFVAFLCEGAGPAEAFAAPGIELLHHPPLESGDECGFSPQLAPFRVAVRIYRSSLEVLDELFRRAARQDAPDLSEATEVSRWASEEAFRSGTRLLGPIQLLRSDTTTYRHCVNVFLMTTALLRPLARDPVELARWARAALLHDLGKARIDPRVLRKPGPLAETEFLHLQRHTEFGAQLLLETEVYDALAVEAAYCHHMRDGGRGYPRRPPDMEPGPVTQAIQVVDMFEALTAPRSYHRARSVRRALRIVADTPGMESRADAIRLLLGALTEAPPGAEVKLDSGARGIVLESRPEEPARPKVLLLENESGEPLPEPQTIDLADVPELRVTAVKLGSGRFAEPA